MLSLGNCRVCASGPLGLRRCGVCRRVVVLCDECDAAWPTGDTRDRPTYATERGDMPCPACGADLLGKGSAWATEAEARATDWLAADTELTPSGGAAEPSVNTADDAPLAADEPHDCGG